MSYRPKKRFGQNFLKDRNIVEQILSAADLKANDRVLEIGPGLGALTDRLLSAVDTVHVIEVDRDLVQSFLDRKDPRLNVHAGDALKMRWEDFLEHPPYKLVANLPYNISSQILFKILDCRHLFERLVLMFQKEVGDRISAPSGTKQYGILSVLCQTWFDIKRVVNVPPGAFFPPPKVDSVVLAFSPLSGPRVPVEDEVFFRRVVKASFAQRRKTLRNTLSNSGFEHEGLDQALLKAGIDPTRRGESLTLKEFSQLAEVLSMLDK